MRAISAMKITDSVSDGRIRRSRNQPKSLADALIALHRQPAELDREDVDQADSRSRSTGTEKPSTEKPITSAVDPGALAVGREHAERHGDQHGDDDGEERQRQRRLDALADQLGHGLLEEEALAEIALQRPCRSR